MVITLIIAGTVIVLLAILFINAKKRMESLKDVKDSEKVVILTDKNFGKSTSNGLVLVDFWADWCMPCKMMVPVLNELAEETSGKVIIAKVNVDEQKEIAAKFGIRSIPTMILFRNGKEIKRIVGVKTRENLMKEIDRQLSL